jgi:hypothetical protein
MLKGYRVGEVGIQTFPREFGTGSSTSMRNIVATIRDMYSTYRRIFSRDYELPANRREFTPRIDEAAEVHGVRFNPEDG